MNPAHSFNPDHSLRGFDGLLRETAPAWFPGDRGDGYHANDPDAPAAWHCDGCDTVRDHRRMFCTSCGEVTGAWLGEGVTALRQWRAASDAWDRGFDRLLADVRATRSAGGAL